jgi:hypothetical protein
VTRASRFLTGWVAGLATHHAIPAELDRGLRTSGTYTVLQAVEDWLRDGLPRRAERTRDANRETTAPLLEFIGSRPLRELTAGDVRAALDRLSTSYSTRYLQLGRAALAQAIKYAEAHDRVGATWRRWSLYRKA